MRSQAVDFADVIAFSASATQLIMVDSSVSFTQVSTSVPVQAGALPSTGFVKVVFSTMTWALPRSTGAASTEVGTRDRAITNASSRDKIFFFISYFLSFEFYANASMANLPRNRGRSGLNSGPLWKDAAAAPLRLGKKKRPAAIGSRAQ